MLTFDARLSTSIHPIDLADYERHILDLGVLSDISFYMPRVTDFLPKTNNPDEAIKSMWDYLDTRVRNHVRTPSPLGRQAPTAPATLAAPTAPAKSSALSIPSIPNNALSQLYYRQAPLGRRQRHSRELQDDCALTMGVLLANAR